MTKTKFFNTHRAVFFTLALGLSVPAINAQPASGMGNAAPMAGKGMMQGMDMKSMMTDMHGKMMGMKSSGNADVDFAMMMRMHHEGAITMSEAQLQNGKDTQMRSLAKDIISAQKKEIAVFDKFLAKQGQSGMKMGDSAMPTNK